MCYNTPHKGDIIMPNDMLEEKVENSYEEIVSHIKATNNEIERKYFAENMNNYIFRDALDGRSFDECFASLKKDIGSGDKIKISLAFVALNNILLFSYKDEVFKAKLKVDNFVSTPIDNLIYPLLLKKVKELYGDSSDISEEEIKIIICTFIDLQSLLFFLYYHDFQFIPDWETLYPNTYQDIILLLKESGMTIGDFLHALVDYKCDIMEGMFNIIQGKNKKDYFFNLITELRKSKHEEIKKYPNINLPITSILDNTFLEPTKKGIRNN